MFKPFFHPLRQALLNYVPSNVAPASMISSVQRGQITIPADQLSADATIPSVNLSSSLLLHLFYIDPLYATLRYLNTHLELINPTTVRASRYFQDGTHSHTVGFSVVEFNPFFINSVQSGQIDLISGFSSETATITAVDLDKSFISHLGLCRGVDSFNTSNYFAAVELLNSTTVRATRGGTSFTLEVFYSVIEAK
ncbi:unnamed protein product [marine sediment metagenome]|uniref:Uncharacterized protein n=1 Tax=marine sediment metagenome TaxID=412755 RepID=X1L315_9ZZZZ